MRWIFLVMVFAVCKVLTEDGGRSVPLPLSIPASANWKGNDGQWSTFSLNVGTPFQRVELLPGTSATAATSIWVVIPQGCTNANPQLDTADCGRSRGNLFASNQSTTWSTSRLGNKGLYNLVTYEESFLGLGGAAYYGFDSISLGTGLPTLQGQVIAGFADNDFWLGSLGLSPLPTNFTTFTSPVPSLLGNLRNMSLVPSTTWAYTAGAIYKDPPAFGSLTFGGYDRARLQDSGVSIGFWTDISRDLLVGLQSIVFDTLGSSPLLVEGIYTFIDSLVTHLWLPLDVCEAFERNFGLVWDDSTSLYLLNSSTHANLQAQNPTFTFTLAASQSGGNTTTITLPYKAFDLNITTPNGTMPYFPLKRAQNRTQFTLGRVFLQEAYVIADYERQNFTVAQAAFSGEQDLVTISPPGFVIETTRRLSTGAIAGIAVGGFVLLALVTGVAFWIMKRRSKKRTQQRAADGTAYVGDGKDPHYQEHYNEDQDKPEGSRHEMAVVEWEKSELLVSETYNRSELPTAEAYRTSELSAASGRGRDRQSGPLYELSGQGWAAELESPRSGK